MSGSTCVSKAQKYYLIRRETPRIDFEPDPRFARGRTSAETAYHKKAERQFETYIERVIPKLDAFIESLIARDGNKYQIAPYKAVWQFDSVDLDPFGRNLRIVVDWGLELEMTFTNVQPETTVSELRRKLQEFFAEHNATEKEPSPAETEPFASRPVRAGPARYTLHIGGMNVSPASFPDDPEASERNVRNVFEGVRRWEESLFASAESLYDPLLQEFFFGDHAYRKFVGFAGNVEDQASIRVHLAVPLTSSLTFYFDNTVPLLLQKIVSFQFVALTGRRTDHFQPWAQEAFEDYTAREALLDAINYEFTYNNSPDGIPFEPRFLANAAKHGETVKQLASRALALAPAEQFATKTPSPDKQSTIESCAIVAAKILDNYFSNSQDVPAILADLITLETEYCLFERERRDALWAVFLGFMEDDDYYIYKREICEALHAIRTRPKTAATALARALCPATSGTAK